MENQPTRSGTTEEQFAADAALVMASNVVGKLGGTFVADGYSGDGTIGAWSYGNALVNGKTIRLAASGGGVVQVNRNPYGPDGKPNISSDQISAAILSVAPAKPATKLDAANALAHMRGFIGHQQLHVISEMARGPEKQFIFDKLVELAAIVQSMPMSYEQDGKGDEAVAYLHYFKGEADFYITERDVCISAPHKVSPLQTQAFGLADCYGDGGEIGYISIAELTATNAELDFYFSPKTLREIKHARICANGFSSDAPTPAEVPNSAC